MCRGEGKPDLAACPLSKPKRFGETTPGHGGTQHIPALSAPNAIHSSRGPCGDMVKAKVSPLGRQVQI